MNIKKGLVALITTAAISTAVQAAYWEFSIYAYLDSNGVQVGTQYIPCFNRTSVTQGTVTNNKVLVERGTCK
ncbi:hypothetical protein L2755_20040 [Shewanella abyssi]|uniref:hypothetical protein n=1 Tax=Shewanella abyssi TaxID=311789 RepID=UPI00200EF04B|nr:hypothetical protein [Shewanella abyssi]MCL1051898.1 hypothetical protein [Shewanella abyssi]